MRELLVLPVQRHLLTTTLGYYYLRKPLPPDVDRVCLQRWNWRFWAIANRFLVEAPPTQLQLPVAPKGELWPTSP
jgi:hypothetical protein